MQVYDWTSVPREEMSPLFTRQVIHGETVTLARIFLKKGCSVPEHVHHNEQMSMVLSGRLKMTVAGEVVVLEPGQVLHLPSNVPHGAEALEDVVATDLFTPRREDWISGDDAYLRGR